MSKREGKSTVMNVSLNYIQEPINIASQIPILSFFTGAGLLDLGFMNAGFPIVWRNEYNSEFVRGFDYAMENMPGNLAGERINNTDSIIEVSSNRIAREAFHNTQRPDCFGVIGGPPCPDFSVGGKNHGREGDHGKLSQIYVSRILELRPTFFLFENVPGLFKTAKHRLFFDLLCTQLRRHFLVEYNMLNALEYGVPQDRQRVFIIGVSKKWAKKNIGFQEKEQNTGWFPWPEPLYKNAKEAFDWPGTIPFGEEPDRPPGIPNELMVGTYICDPVRWQLPNSTECFIPHSNKFHQIPEGDVSRKSFKRLHRWRFSPSAAYGNNEVHLHPVEPRRLTVREAMRIQTIPDIYAFPADMPLSHKFKTIGNGVPVKLAEAIASSFVRLLGGETRE